MYIFIIKDEHIHAIANDDSTGGEYSLLYRDDIPPYPEDGKSYKLDLVNGEPSWVEIEKDLPAQEILDTIIERLGF